MPGVPGVALPRPQKLEPRKLLVSSFQRQRQAGAILNVCGVHSRSKNKATGINEYEGTAEEVLGDRAIRFKAATESVEI
jgi:hypothetical protein